MESKFGRPAPSAGSEAEAGGPESPPIRDREHLRELLVHLARRTILSPKNVSSNLEEIAATAFEMCI